MFDPTVIGDAITAITGLITPYTAVIGVGAVVALAGLLLRRLGKAAR